MKKYLVYIALFFPFFAQAQQQLTLQGAIDTALRNNFDIRIAKNNAGIGKIQNTYGFAGGLPTIAATAGDNGALSNINQELTDGSTVNESGVLSNTIDAGVFAGIVLFNGFRIMATKERLNALAQQGELMLNLQVQNTIAAIMVKYYDIVRQQNYLKIIQHSLEVSTKKFEIIRERDKVGMASAADILQARMDVNASEQHLKLEELVVEQAKADLCLLMGGRQYTPFVVNDSIVADPALLLDSVTRYLDRNPQLLSAEQQIRINEQVVKELAAQRYPSVKINTGYDYRYSRNYSGLTGMNQAHGPYAGITLQIPIYNGNTYKIQQRSAEFDLDNATLQQERLLTSLKSNALKTYLSYSTALKQIESQSANYELSKQLVEVVLLNFQMNQATILDVKTAQTTFEEAAYLLVNLQYSAKVAEIELKQLTYQLSY